MQHCVNYTEILWGAWLAQVVEHGTLDLGVVSSSPMMVVEPSFYVKEGPQSYISFGP